MAARKLYNVFNKASLFIVIGLIKLYRNFISPLKPKTCRFYPSCSHYAVESLEKYGIIVGAYKSLIRVLRCHPFNPGGYDPVK